MLAAGVVESGRNTAANDKRFLAVSDGRVSCSR